MPSLSDSRPSLSSRMRPPCGHAAAVDLTDRIVDSWAGWDIADLHRVSSFRQPHPPWQKALRCPCAGKSASALSSTSRKTRRECWPRERPLGILGEATATRPLRARSNPASKRYAMRSPPVWIAAPKLVGGGSSLPANPWWISGRTFRCDRSAALGTGGTGHHRRRLLIDPDDDTPR
jgi:hypothetical protein